MSGFDLLMAKWELERLAEEVVKVVERDGRNIVDAAEADSGYSDSGSAWHGNAGFAGSAGASASP